MRALRQIDAGSATRVVQVIVGESGNDRSAAEVNLLGRGARERADGIGRTDRDEAPVGDRHGLGRRERGVHRDDSAAVQDEVWRGGLRAHARRLNEAGGEAEHQHSEGGLSRHDDGTSIHGIRSL